MPDYLSDDNYQFYLVSATSVVRNYQSQNAKFCFIYTIYGMEHTGRVTRNGLSHLISTTHYDV